MTAMICEISDHIATITLNRPERMNTISSAMLDELTRTFVAVNENPDVRVVILTGTGRAFCAGLDLNEASAGQGIGGKDRRPPETIDLRNTPQIGRAHV